MAALFTWQPYVHVQFREIARSKYDGLANVSSLPSISDERAWQDVQPLQLQSRVWLLELQHCRRHHSIRHPLGKYTVNWRLMSCANLFVFSFSSGPLTGAPLSRASFNHIKRASSASEKIAFLICLLPSLIPWAMIFSLFLMIAEAFDDDKVYDLQMSVFFVPFSSFLMISFFCCRESDARFEDEAIMNKQAYVSSTFHRPFCPFALLFLMQRWANSDVISQCGTLQPTALNWNKVMYSLYPNMARHGEHWKVLVKNGHILAYLILKFDDTFENARSNRLFVIIGSYCIKFRMI